MDLLFDIGVLGDEMGNMHTAGLQGNQNSNSKKTNKNIPHQSMHNFNDSNRIYGNKNDVYITTEFIIILQNVKMLKINSI